MRKIEDNLTEFKESDDSVTFTYEYLQMLPIIRDGKLTINSKVPAKLAAIRTHLKQKLPNCLFHVWTDDKNKLKGIHIYSRDKVILELNQLNLDLTEIEARTIIQSLLDANIIKSAEAEGLKIISDSLRKIKKGALTFKYEDTDTPKLDIQCEGLSDAKLQGILKFLKLSLREFPDCVKLSSVKTLEDESIHTLSIFQMTPGSDISQKEAVNFVVSLYDKALIKEDEKVRALQTVGIKKLFVKVEFVKGKVWFWFDTFDPVSNTKPRVDDNYHALFEATKVALHGDFSDRDSDADRGCYTILGLCTAMDKVNIYTALGNIDSSKFGFKYVDLAKIFDDAVHVQGLPRPSVQENQQENQQKTAGQNKPASPWQSGQTLIGAPGGPRKDASGANAVSVHSRSSSMPLTSSSTSALAT